MNLPHRKEEFLSKSTNSAKFIYSEKATKICEIFTVDLSYVVLVKSTVEILQSFVAFSEYMNFSKKFSLNSLQIRKKYTWLI